MAPIEVSVDIARPPQEVFAYVTDPSRFAEWQAGVVGGYMEDGGPYGRWLQVHDNATDRRLRTRSHRTDHPA